MEETRTTRVDRYSYANQRRIRKAKPNATRVAGTKAWKELGRAVRPGEKGIAIYAPIRNPDDEEEVAGYRVVRVYDVTQTEEAQASSASPVQHIRTPPAARATMEDYYRHLVRVTLDRQYDADRPIISGPDDAYRLFAPLAKEAREVFVVASLDSRLALNALDEVGRGSTNEVVLAIPEILKTVIVSNAIKFIVAHNHPSGDPTPSREDTAITRKLTDAANMVGLKCLDHLIIGQGRYYSMTRASESTEPY